MNAPFQARAGLRDPFQAFVCDDSTADMLRPVAVEHGWSPEKVNKGGGKILMGPHEVPGGSWIVQCVDPQGANFALVATKR